MNNNTIILYKTKLPYELICKISSMIDAEKHKDKFSNCLVMIDKKFNWYIRFRIIDCNFKKRGYSMRKDYCKNVRGYRHGKCENCGLKNVKLPPIGDKCARCDGYLQLSTDDEVDVYKCILCEKFVDEKKGDLCKRCDFFKNKNDKNVFEDDICIKCFKNERSYGFCGGCGEVSGLSGFCLKCDGGNGDYTCFKCKQWLDKDDIDSDECSEY